MLVFPSSIRWEGLGLQVISVFQHSNISRQDTESSSKNDFLFKVRLYLVSYWFLPIVLLTTVNEEFYTDFCVSRWSCLRKPV